MSESAAAALSGVQTEQPTGDNGATETSTWTSGLGEDSLAYIQNKGWESPENMLESYRSLEKFAGGSKSLVELPGVDADDETMSAFYDRLGRPESPDQYGFEAPENADADLMNWFGETAHKHGLSQKQAQAIFGEWNEMSTSRMEQFESMKLEQAEADIGALKKEWGADYDKNINSGRIAAQNLGYDEQALSSLEDKMGTAEMLKLFSNLGSKMGEDSFVSGDSSGGFGTTPAQAQAEINNLKLDKQFMDAYLSGDKAAVTKMKGLMERAYG